uniref:Immunoglobulin domain-containing protein n=1 Tax=Sinocyclocheilus anshuiensis TaxID=1608454 RepID=A0A671R170_9TELE
MEFCFYRQKILQQLLVCVSDAPEQDKMKTKSVKEGESVTLDPGVVKTTNYLMKWLFNGIRITEINGDISFNCTDVQCNNGAERFRGRLRLDHQTGSLTITNTRTTDSGLYKLQISSSRFTIIKSFIVNVTGYADAEKVSVMEGDSVNGKERFRDRLKVNYMTGSLTITNIRTTDSGLFKLQNNSSSESLVQLFSVSVYYAPEQDKMKTKSVKEGESVTLDPGVVKTTNYLMKWLFNGIRITEINGDISFNCTDVQCNNGAERFRGRLRLDHQTGSLTITNTRTTDSGLYTLQINSSSESLFHLLVCVSDVPAAERDEIKRKSVKEGESCHFIHWRN